MAHDVATKTGGELTSSSNPDDSESRPRRRRSLKVLLGAAVGLVVLIVVAGLWLVLGRDRATELTVDDALADFRSADVVPLGDPTSETSDRPGAGVYPATASGTESIGLPGFDEELGPNSPVTVTHGSGGCFTYRTDLNSHHWRSWTFCPTDSAIFSLTRLESFTARKAPGLDIATLSTYTCERPLDFLWQGAAVGDTRTGACTGTSDIDDSVTADAGSIEVLQMTSRTVGDEKVDVMHLRTTDTFSGAQTGSEVNEWWIDATTGLPVAITVDAKLAGGASDYAETAELELTSLTPAT